MDKMSPASKSMSKDKKSGKDPQKAFLKPSGPAAVGAGVSASAYNLLLGTFHTLESAPPNLSACPHDSSGRFWTMDEGDEQHGGSLGALVECDTASNNGSWSGDSEDHKEKGSSLSGRQELAPGVDSDKREKNRHKNEKKHQRQKEKRAQELHDRCRSYLVSRKLEALTQQLVGMGFPHQRAAMALMLNEGRVEESVAWLFEGSEEDGKAHEDQDSDRSNLRIDISDELAQIAAMESRYRCSKQEVERAVVSCEGDVERASDMLRTQKQEQSSNAKPVDMEEDTTLNRNATSHIPARPQLRHGPSSSSMQRRDDKDYNSTNAAVDSNGHWESGVNNVQPAKRYQPKLDWAAKPKHYVIPTEKSWAKSGANSSMSYSMAAPVTASKRGPLYVAIGSEIKPLPPGSATEPVTVMQRPQSANQKHSSVPFVGSPPGPAASWHPANSQLDVIKSSGLSSQIPPSGRNPIPRSATSGTMHNQLNYQQQMGLGSTLVQRQQFMPSGGVVGDVLTPSRGNPLWQGTGAYPTFAAASSLGLFSSAGSGSGSASSGPVNWTDGGIMLKLDYTNIDWSLEATTPRSSSLWLGLSSVSSSSFGLPASMSGLKNAESSSLEASGARDWTSPFEGRDLFSLPRQFVASPSL